MNDSNSEFRIQTKSRDTEKQTKSSVFHSFKDLGMWNPLSYTTPTEHTVICFFSIILDLRQNVSLWSRHSSNAENNSKLKNFLSSFGLFGFVLKDCGDKQVVIKQQERCSSLAVHCVCLFFNQLLRFILSLMWAQIVNKLLWKLWFESVTVVKNLRHRVTWGCLACYRVSVPQTKVYWHGPCIVELL